MPHFIAVRFPDIRSRLTGFRNSQPADLPIVRLLDLSSVASLQEMLALALSLIEVYVQATFYCRILFC